MKVLVIQPKIGMGDMVIYLPYIHAIAKKFQTSVSILVKENSRAKDLLIDDDQIKEIITLDRTSVNNGSHDGIRGFFKLIQELKKNKIPVMGHIGYTPQFKKKFKVEGDTEKKAKKLLKEAMLIEKAGAFSIVLECLTSKTSNIITKKLKIPLDKYIDYCLYNKKNGYYMTKNPFGKKGDFTTAPNISRLFSEIDPAKAYFSPFGSFEIKFSGNWIDLSIPGVSNKIISALSKFL